VARRCAHGLAGLLLLSLAGCAHLPGWGRAVPTCPGQLVPTSQIRGDLLLRQRVRIEAGDTHVVLRLITQKRGDELLLLGIDPLGAKLFTLRQRGSEVEVEALPARVLAVEPITLLRELHRMRFLSVPTPPAGAPFVIVRQGTEISERWQEASLRERRFRRLDEQPAGVVTIRFEAPGPGEEGLERISIDNGWCGYRAEIVTLVEQPGA
jgi:hypothetical protein